MQVKLTVLTPIWNRLEFVPGLVNCVSQLQDEIFEWVIVDDGSTDGSLEKLTELVAKHSMDFVTIFSVSPRQGKACADNLLINSIRGDYFTWLDSDDLFVVDSLRVILRRIEALEFRPRCVGASNVSSRTLGSWTGTSCGVSTNPRLMNYEQFKSEIPNDCTLLFDKSIARDIHFPEIDFVVHESLVWADRLKATGILYFDQIVKIQQRDAENSISFGKKIRYSYGSYVAAKLNFLNKRSMKSEIKQAFLMGRYAGHSRQFTDLIFSTSHLLNARYLIYFASSFGYLAGVTDRIFGRVEDTRLEFECNRSKRVVRKII